MEVHMQRQRYEITLRCGTTDSVFWANRLEEVRPLMALAGSGAQSDQNMALAVRDTCTGARGEVSCPSSIGFTAAAYNLLDSVGATQPRPIRQGAGRDVVVEVQFAAHGATLDQCRSFAYEAMEQALLNFTHDARSDGPQYSFNGESVGEAWFQ
jgi:hypothetical protein